MADLLYIFLSEVLRSRIHLRELFATTEVPFDQLSKRNTRLRTDISNQVKPKFRQINLFLFTRN